MRPPATSEKKIRRVGQRRFSGLPSRGQLNLSLFLQRRGDQYHRCPAIVVFPLLYCLSRVAHRRPLPHETIDSHHSRHISVSHHGVLFAGRRHKRAAYLASGRRPLQSPKLPTRDFSVENPTRGQGLRVCSTGRQSHRSKRPSWRKYPPLDLEGPWYLMKSLRWLEKGHGQDLVLVVSPSQNLMST